MIREPSQTTENPTNCTGCPVPTIKSWDACSGLETKNAIFSLTVQTFLTQSM